jgi:archaeal type IV pilus assembly protein PilA
VRDPAVSSVISEVLMIALVLILVPIVTMSLMNQLPEGRVPTVLIKMGPFDGSSVTLYHKGGDWIRKEDIRILLNGNVIGFSYNRTTFDLGDTISVQGIPDGGNISFIVKNAVVFSGVAHP